MSRKFSIDMLRRMAVIAGSAAMLFALTGCIELIDEEPADPGPAQEQPGGIPEVS